MLRVGGSPLAGSLSNCLKVVRVVKYFGPLPASCITPLLHTYIYIYIYTYDEFPSEKTSQPADVYLKCQRPPEYENIAC